MARERIHVDNVYPEDDENVVTTGGSGFGIMAILVGVERHFIGRREALERLEKIVGFLGKADRFHGAFPHWLNGETGKVKPFSPKDDGAALVETAYLMQGLLTARQYLANGTPQEKKLSSETTCRLRKRLLGAHRQLFHRRICRACTRQQQRPGCDLSLGCPFVLSSYAPPIHGRHEALLLCIGQKDFR